MDYETFFRYWYAPLCSTVSAIVSLLFGYWIAVLIQNRQFHREDMIRKQEKEAAEISKRPNPIEIDILRHCLEQPPEDGKYHFSGVNLPSINNRPVGNYTPRAIRQNLQTLRENGYIGVFFEGKYELSFTMLIDSEKLACVINEAENRL